jgi:hypothetical protein
MDWDQLLEDLKKAFPIFVSVLSGILSIGAFVLNFNVQSLAVIISTALAGTLLISLAVLWFARRRSFSRHSQEFYVLDTEDICDITDPRGKTATYKRIITFKVKKPAPVYVTYPAIAEGVQREFKAYKYDDPATKYDVYVQMSGGRKVLFVNFGRQLKKNEIIDRLCVEWEYYNTFGNDHESVTVYSEPNQRSCSIQVVLPQESAPTTTEWFATYGTNPLPIHSGTIEVKKDRGRHVLFHDFSPYLKSAIHLNFAICWRNVYPGLLMNDQLAIPAAGLVIEPDRHEGAEKEVLPKKN